MIMAPSAIASDSPATAPAISTRPINTLNVSFANLALQPSLHPPSVPKLNTHEPTWQTVNRHSYNIDPDKDPSPPSHVKALRSPFLVFDYQFASVLGKRPTLDLLITDSRAAFFHSGGAWIPSISTLFLTSALLHDHDPAAVSSAYRRTEITKIEFFAPNEFRRDKVRCVGHSYMAAGCSQYPSHASGGIVICAQGSLNEPAGLVHIDAKPPHRARVLLNNFHGRSFNSPGEIVTNFADNCLYFLDPASGYERGFRRKPALPSGHIYRFDPQTGDCRVVANGLVRPAGLAFSPDYSTLYVSELGDKYGGTTIYAFDVLGLQPLPSSSNMHNGSSLPESDGVPNPTTPTSSVTSSSGSTKSRPSPWQRKPPSTKSKHRDGGDISTTNQPVSNHESGVSRDDCQTPASSPCVLRLPAFGPTRNPTPTRLISGLFLAKQRLFAYSPSGSPSGGISVDPLRGDVWLGTEEGVEVWNGQTGEMIGKIVVEDGEQEAWAQEDDEEEKVISLNKPRRKTMRGVSKVAFGQSAFEEGRREVWLLGGQRLWRVGLGVLR